MVISLLGVWTGGQTDTISESSYGTMLAHKKFQLKLQNYELAVDRYMHPWMTGIHKYRLQPDLLLGLILLSIYYIGRGYYSPAGVARITADRL